MLKLRQLAHQVTGLGKAPLGQKYVRFIPITQINPDRTAKLVKQLESMKKGNKVDAICVGINSSDDSVVSADQMGVLLRRKAKELEVPLVTYAEDQVFNAGWHLLMYGDTHLANKTSILGNVGYRRTPWNLKQFTADKEVQVKFITKGENKMRLNRFEDFKDEDKEWARNLYQKMVDHILEHSKQVRGDKIDAAGWQKLESGDIILGKEALERGLVDGLSTPEQYFTEFFGKDQFQTRVCVPQPSFRQKFGIDTSMPSLSRAIDNNLLTDFGTCSDQVTQLTNTDEIIKEFMSQMEAKSNVNVTQNMLMAPISKNF